MNRGEAEKHLRAAGFVKDERSRHVVWKNGDIAVTLHRGTKTTDRLLRQVRQAVRRAGQRTKIDEMLSMLSPAEKTAFTTPPAHMLFTPQAPLIEETNMVTEQKRLHNAKYTAEDMIEVERLFKEGKSDTEIAEAMKDTHPGMTKKLVTYVRLYHLKMRRKEMPSRTETPKRRKYSRKEMGLLRKMNADGYTDAQIAKVLSETRPGTTESAISSLRHKKGIDKGTKQIPLPLGHPPVVAFKAFDTTTDQFSVTIMEGDKIKVKCPVNRDTAKTIVDMLMGW